MIASCILGIFFILFVAVQSSMPAAFTSSLQKPDTGGKFWGMSRNQPIRKELESDPGVLLGKIEDFDINRFHQVDFRKLLKGLEQQPSSISPIEIFLRKQRSETKQCNIQYETVMVTTRPGRCIKMRDNTPACKHDDYIAVNYEECAD